MAWVIVLLLLGFGRLVLFVMSEVQAASNRRARAADRLRELVAETQRRGLDERSLSALLSAVPHGWKEHSLYRAWRYALTIGPGSGRLQILEAVCGLARGLDEHRDAQSRRAAEAAEARRLGAEAAVRRRAAAELARRKADELAARRHARMEQAARRAAELAALVTQAGVPPRHQLVVSSSDRTRENAADRDYRKRMLLRLLGLYGNQCAICGANDAGLDLDHFFVPKSQGGNFALTRHDGIKVNNAVPMCESCNRAKGARPYDEFLRGREERLRVILRLNVQMNRLLNGLSQTEAAPPPPPAPTTRLEPPVPRSTTWTRHPRHHPAATFPS